MQQRVVCVGLALALAATGGPCLAQSLAQNLAKNVTRTQPAATTQPTPQSAAVQSTAPPSPPSLSAQASAAPASAPRYSVDTKFSDLLADPRATEVVITFFIRRRAAAGKPEPTAQERAHTIELIRDMTPREVSIFPQAEMDEAALIELNAELAKLPGPASAQASGSSGPASK